MELPKHPNRPDISDEDNSIDSGQNLHTGHQGSLREVDSSDTERSAPGDGSDGEYSSSCKLADPPMKFYTSCSLLLLILSTH